MVEKNEKRKYVPNTETYKKTLTSLIEHDQDTTLMCVRMGCEMGMTRIEIVNARVSDMDRYNKRGLWIKVAKAVRRGKKRMEDGTLKPKFEMRSREVPVNPELYQLIKSYADEDQVFILKRKKGKIDIPFAPRYINTLYEKANIPWSSHKSRHFFKSQIWAWMRENRQVDPGLVKDLMGHKKTVTEIYGSISWDYKCGVVDKVFG